MQISAKGLTEKGFILESNFHESPGPPTALQLTATLDPSERYVYEPCQGIWCLTPGKEISYRPHPNDTAPPEYPLGA